MCLMVHLILWVSKSQSLPHLSIIDLTRDRISPREIRDLLDGLLITRNMEGSENPRMIFRVSREIELVLWDHFLTDHTVERVTQYIRASSASLSPSRHRPHLVSQTAS